MREPGEGERSTWGNGTIRNGSPARAATSRRSGGRISASETVPDGGRKIPLWIKLPYTAFLAVLIPFYWRTYGPVNFLWFCDVALLVTLPALWLESPFLSSMRSEEHTSELQSHVNL